jgi:hypothetical protein
MPIRIDGKGSVHVRNTKIATRLISALAALTAVLSTAPAAAADLITVSGRVAKFMDWIRLWIRPALLLLVWITVLSYTISMVATVEPTLRALGQQSLQENTSSPTPSRPVFVSARSERTSFHVPKAG